MNMNKKTIHDIDVKGKRVLARVDFNVPIKDGIVMDETRIKGAMPTINYLLEQGAKLILVSHLGRPKGEFNDKYSIKPAAARLAKLLGRDVPVAADVVGESAKAMVAALQDGDLCMLENVRFMPGEEKNDPQLAKELAQLADIYVNDAFGAAHRAHASTAGVAQYLPAVAGLLIGKELAVMGGALQSPKRPFVAILGGAKVSDKIGVINNLLEKVDALLIGGAMAYTFKKAQGHTIGTSLVEEDKLDLAKELLAKAQSKNVRLLLPSDDICGKAFSNETEMMTCEMDIPDGWMGLDIGPISQKAYAAEIAKAGTVIWNGPMGAFEMENFASGTRAIAQALADNADCISIIGGGDSAAAVEQMGFGAKMTHISTGGGASLEFLEGKVLPGVACLNDK